MYVFRRFLAVLAFAVGVAAIHPAAAQTPPVPVSAELEKQYDAAFQEMLAKPADLDVLFRFAALATQTGDLEGAISALERMLLINPNLPRVRLELGVLYFRLGSYEVARTYLESVLKAQTLPPDVRSKAEQFMAEIESRSSPSRFTGEVFFGFRYQSNANLGPPTSSVRLFGQTANLNASAIGTADWGAVSSLSVKHTYDFGRQERAFLETQFTAYGSRQFTLSTANVSLLDFVTGPRFQILAGIFEDVELRPFFALGQIWVNDTPYYGSYGGGMEVNSLLGNGFRNNTTALWRRHNNFDTWYLPTNSTFRGTEYSASTTFSYQFNQLLGFFLQGAYQRYETDINPTQSYILGGGTAGVSVRFLDPVLNTNLPWTLTLAVTQQFWRYDAPDPQVDPNVERRQYDSIFNLTFSVPFDERTTLSISGGRMIRYSDIPNYAFENNNVMFGVSWRF